MADIIRSSDGNIGVLVGEIRKRFRSKAGSSPYSIESNVSRLDVDLNRPVETVPAHRKGFWERYHSIIRKFIKECLERYGFCLLFDLHGYRTVSGSKEEIHLGYGLDNDEIERMDCRHSSVQPLSKRLGTTSRALIYGKGSLCDIIEKNGLPCVPSSTTPEDLRMYFNGGFAVRHYSDRHRRDPFGAIQMEFPSEMREIKSIPRVGRIIADSILKFSQRIRRHLNKKSRRRKRKAKKKTRKR